MEYQLLPDLIAMTAMIGVMLSLRRRYPQARLNAWLVGLTLILLEETIFAFYDRTSPWAHTVHAVMMNCYVIASAAFLLSATEEQQLGRRRFWYIAVNLIPQMALMTLYGYYRQERAFYLAVAAIAVLLGLATARKTRSNYLPGVTYFLLWGPLAWAAWQRDFRTMAYGSLFFLYALCALMFWRVMPRGSNGKRVIVMGLAFWAMVFLTHPMVAKHPKYIGVANAVWDMQKFVITTGMVLLLLEEEITNKEWMALHDALTGLPNRRLFDDRLEHGLAMTERGRTVLGLLMIDLNGFKQVNDTLGHEAGDLLLREVAQRMQKMTRKSDTLARTGGDEFGVITMQAADREQMERIARSLRAAVAEPIMLGKHGIVRMTISIGVAVYPADAQDFTTLCAAADKKMYEDKKAFYRQEAALAARSPA